MLKINQFSQLATLPIPPSLIEQIKKHLLEPFDNEKQAEELWSELNCQLWFLTAEDNQPEDEASRNLLPHAFSYPE